MRAETAALLAACYLVAMFVWHRLRVLRRRAAGPSLELLRRFDYRAVWEELLPSLPQHPAALAPSGQAPAAAPDLAPRFYLESPWELPEPFAYKAERDALRSGAVPRCDARDPNVAWLLVHFAIRRIFEGDLDGAEAIAERLEEETSGRLLATIELARAERAALVHDAVAAHKAALAALAHAQGLREPSLGTMYLVAHIKLAWLTNDVNLELSVAMAALSLRQALRSHGNHPFLFFGLAHAHSLLGRHEEALDELGKALSYARGDAFYAKAILEDGYVWRARPALAAQCRVLGEDRSAAQPVLPPAGGGR
ncbi:MAG: hypothetical protein HY901_21340 [Deltaproteobacteria bacterium]|nr:hypothetical protein [Deltaproteobacteria bacterium]